MAKFVCPHNDEIDCDNEQCNTCGWNPKVARRRLREMTHGKGKLSSDKKFKIPFKGYCEVWADTEEEALALADNDEMFFVQYDFGDPICEEDDR